MNGKKRAREDPASGRLPLASGDWGSFVALARDPEECRGEGPVGAPPVATPFTRDELLGYRLRLPRRFRGAGLGDALACARVAMFLREERSLHLAARRIADLWAEADLSLLDEALGREVARQCPVGERVARVGPELAASAEAELPWPCRAAPPFPVVGKAGKVIAIGRAERSEDDSIRIPDGMALRGLVHAKDWSRVGIVLQGICSGVAHAFLHRPTGDSIVSLGLGDVVGVTMSDSGELFVLRRLGPEKNEILVVRDGSKEAETAGVVPWCFRALSPNGSLVASTTWVQDGLKVEVRRVADNRVVCEARIEPPKGVRVNRDDVHACWNAHSSSILVVFVEDQCERTTYASTIPMDGKASKSARIMRRSGNTLRVMTEGAGWLVVTDQIDYSRPGVLAVHVRGAGPDGAIEAHRYGFPGTLIPNARGVVAIDASGCEQWEWFSRGTVFVALGANGPLVTSSERVRSDPSGVFAYSLERKIHMRSISPCPDECVPISEFFSFFRKKSPRDRTYRSEIAFFEAIVL